MRHFPFKILILCVLLPPFLYIYSLQFLERAIQTHCEGDLASRLIGDVTPLLEGTTRLRDVLQKNIHAFIARHKLVNWGVEIDVTITTQNGDYLFPHGYEETRSDFGTVNTFALAQENYRLLSDGMIPSVKVKIAHNTLIANGILFAFVLLSLSVLFLFYRRGARKIRADELAAKKMIKGLADEHQRHLKRLGALENQRSELNEKIEQMKEALAAEREKISAAEDEMVEELVALEEKIDQHEAEQNQRLQEIDVLRNEINRYEREKTSRKRHVIKGGETFKKRFNVLYKNLAVHDKAIRGFINLTEELQIKAEEVIHQLNDDVKMVPVKRKVFGKKNRETVFEVIFAYKGRLYYRTIAGSRIEVLVVGTKLTQNKDLAFLDKL